MTTLDLTWHEHAACRHLAAAWDAMSAEARQHMCKTRCPVTALCLIQGITDTGASAGAYRQGEATYGGVDAAELSGETRRIRRRNVGRGAA